MVRGYPVQFDACRDNTSTPATHASIEVRCGVNESRRACQQLKWSCSRHSEERYFLRGPVARCARVHLWTRPETAADTRVSNQRFVLDTDVLCGSVRDFQPIIYGHTGSTSEKVFTYSPAGPPPQHDLVLHAQPPLCGGGDGRSPWAWMTAAR